MKKVHKIIFVLFIIINICLITCETYAAGISDIWEKGNSFLNKGSESIGKDFGFDTSDGIAAIKAISDFLWGIGLLVIAVSTVVLGMKYMLVLPDEKSRIKQATTPYIIGVIIIFGAVSIWKLVIDILEGSLLG